MNSRLLLYTFMIATFFACGEKEKKADTTTSEKTSTTTDTSLNKEKEASTKIEKALSLDDKIKMIKTNFSAVENQLSALDKKVSNEDVGGGFIGNEAYFDNGIPQKVKHGNYGEHGSISHTFYLKDNNLFFVFEEKSLFKVHVLF